MIRGVDTLTAQPPVDAAPASGRVPVPAVLGAVAGCLFLVVAASPEYGNGLQYFPYSAIFTGGGTSSLDGWLVLSAPVLATALGLCLLRWWPYLLASAALLIVPILLLETNHAFFPTTVYVLPTAGFYLALMAVLACAQGLIRTSVGWAAAVAALPVGAHELGTALAAGPGWDVYPYSAVAHWHVALYVLALTGLAPAVWHYRRGDQAAAGPADRHSWQRDRVIAAGTLAAAVSIPLAFLNTQQLASLLGVSWSALYRHNYAETALIGAIAVVVVALLATLAGRWPLAGTLTAALVLSAVTVPAALAVRALDINDPLRLAAALAGAVLGAVVAGNRWRFPLAAALTVLATTTLFIAYAATTGDPEKLEAQHTVIPAALILVLTVAATAAVVGSTVPVLAPRGALPAVLGPLAGIMAVGGTWAVEATYDNVTQAPGDAPAQQLPDSAVLMLVAGAAIGGLGFARLLANRRAERKHAEQIRREAAEAERDRLARPIHDGVLQVLALVQRHGSELGEQGVQLAALAGEQEVALRNLLASGAITRRDTTPDDLRAPLQALATPSIDVSTPAQPVALPAHTTAEVIAAVRAALDNVRQHAGDDAHAWVLLEDEDDGVRVTVRDDGVGFPPQRLAEAEQAGRLGIVQSMRGRIADHGGTTTIHSQPNEGTEVEFWIPR